VTLPDLPSDTPDGPGSQDLWLSPAASADLGWFPAVFDDAEHLLVTEHPQTYCLLVCHRDRLICERYYHGHGRETLFDVRSVTKSVLSLLIGIAIGDGHFSLETTLRDLVPDLLPAGGSDRVGAIQIQHLLSMTAGFEWDDMEDIYRLQASDDWVSTVLHTPIVAAPGDVFTYNSGCSQVLAAILTRRTGQSVADYASERLFRLLHIVPGIWPKDPRGINIGGFGLRLQAPDMVKLGLLVLRNGAWGSTQLAPPGYLQAATTPKSEGGFPEETPYGYHWWTSRVAGHETVFAAGYGGQYICCVPDRELVVVTTAFWRAPPDELSDPNVLIREIIHAAPA
jgi:CubicO group peptidase (beta-lactamase class C family)